MTNLYKQCKLFKQIVIILTILTIFSCSRTSYNVKKIEASKTNINLAIAETTAIETFIKPYRTRIDAEMNTILSIAGQNFDKSGQWQTAMGNLLADATMRVAAPVFLKNHSKSLDICLLNHGGIRANISKGNVTTRTAFEVMPFENSLIIVAMKGSVVVEMIKFIIDEKKPHPLNGLTFNIDKSNNPNQIMIQGKPINLDMIYYVATSDYLATGGDKMDFFKKGVDFFDMNYKLRNILIDYFKQTPILPVATDTRISID